jgi:hypothetical protein
VARISSAELIWRPYGVAVRRSDDGPVDVRLEVAVKSRPRPAALRRGQAAAAGQQLGAITFDDRGVPGSAIALDPDAIAATLAQSDVGAAELSTHVAGRALGRVLAHEIGHHLLALPSHTPDGLMRSAFLGSELAAPDRRAFLLNARLLSRLRIRLARLRLDPPRDWATTLPVR